MTTCISFCRDRIRHNIPIGRGLLPRYEARPPIFVETIGPGDWFVGVDIADEAEVFYLPPETKPRHKAYLTTDASVRTIRDLECTVDAPKRNKNLIYIYVQTTRIPKGEKPPLTVHLHCREAERWVWRSLCAWRIKIHGSSKLVSSLGYALPWTSQGDNGARVWIETESAVSSGLE